MPVRAVVQEYTAAGPVVGKDLGRSVPGGTLGAEYGAFSSVKHESSVKVAVMSYW
jgi:hypothetical protein